MANTIFEKQGGTYTQVGDYMLPDLLPAEEETEANIGVWAMRHKRYLKQNHKVIYYNLLTSGKLNSYLACLLYTSPSPRDGATSRMPSSA